MTVTVNDSKTYTKNELNDARMKLASKSWLYETGIEDGDNFSAIFSSKDEKKVHREEKKDGRNYTCRYRRENGTLVVEFFEFGMWN